MKNILRTILVLFILSNCIAICITSASKRLQKDHLVNNVGSSYHGPYDYLTKDGDVKIIMVEYISYNKNCIEKLEPILRNNIRNFVIKYNAKELTFPSNCTDSLLYIIRNTLFEFDVAAICNVTIKE